MSEKQDEKMRCSICSKSPAYRGGVVYLKGAEMGDDGRLWETHTQVDAGAFFCLEHYPRAGRVNDSPTAPIDYGIPQQFLMDFFRLGAISPGGDVLEVSRFI